MLLWFPGRFIAVTASYVCVSTPPHLDLLVALPPVMCRATRMSPGASYKDGGITRSMWTRLSLCGSRPKSGRIAAGFDGVCGLLAAG